MFRNLLIISTLVLSGCSAHLKSTTTVTSTPDPVVQTENYDKLCGDIHLRKDERAKVELEATGNDWDTLECREAAFEEFINAND